MTVVSALSLSFLLEYWYKTNVYEMITHYTSYQQCQTVSNNVNSVNSVNSVNNVNSYSAVLPPSPMVFFYMIASLIEVFFRNSSYSLLFVLVFRGDPISASSPNSWHSSLSPWCSYPLSPSSSPRLMSCRRFFLEKIKIQY